jgi:ABC-type transport system involved in multi-copper enzyme maturation permease subunit
MQKLKRLTTRLPLQVNPVIVKELRSRMRGPRAFIILTVFLALMGLVSYALYEITLITSSWSYSPLSPQVGQTLFISLAVLEMLMVLILTPAVTAGAISSEHEKLTYEMLVTTPLSPPRILWGKLVSALSYIFLLILSAIPLASLVFIYGGVSLRDMLKAFIVVFITAVMIGTIGIFMSTWLKRSGRATIFSYLIVLALAVAPTFVYGVVAVLRQAEPPRWILVPSPISALMSSIAGSTTLGQSSISMLGGLSMILSGNINVISTTSIPRPLYHYTLPLYGLLTLVLYLLATRLVRPARRWRMRRKEILLAFASIALLVGLWALAFGVTSNRYENYSIFTVPTPFPVMAEPFARVEQSVPMVPLDIVEDDGVQIYSQVLADMANMGIFQAGNTIAISRSIYADPANPDAPQDTIVVMSDTVQAGITASLGQMSIQVLWLDDFFAFPPQDAGVLAGALVTFGDLNMPADENLQVLASVYTLDQPGTHLSFELSNQDGVWQVVASQTLP